MAVIPKFVGERIKRREDPRLITGTGLYVDDVRLPGMLTAVILRSPYAHAKINSLNLEAARTLPGVVAVFCGGLAQSPPPGWGQSESPDWTGARPPAMSRRRWTASYSAAPGTGSRTQAGLGS